MREVDPAADDRRARGHHQRRHDHRRQAGERQGAPGPEPLDGVPELRALPAHDGVREHRLPAAAVQDARRRGAPPGGRGGRRPGTARTPRPETGEPLRWSAPARGHGPGDRAAGRGVPLRRAPLQPRRQAARPDAHRDLPPAAPARDHHGLRDPRPDRGHDPGRPGLRAAQGPHPAGGLTAGALRAAGQPVRGRVHRLAADELPAGDPRGHAPDDALRADRARRTPRQGGQRSRSAPGRHPAGVLRGRIAGRRGQAAPRLGLPRAGGRHRVAGGCPVRLHPLRGPPVRGEAAARAVARAGLRGAAHPGHRVHRLDQPHPGGAGGRVLARQPQGARVRSDVGREPDPRPRGGRRADPAGGGAADRGGPGVAGGGRRRRARRRGLTIPGMPGPGRDPSLPWWRSAVIYEVYIRSFADSDGDGEGDIAGLRRRLPYLADLGVDAVWITPWCPSPMADGGYDVSDYCDVDPRFGSLADVAALLSDAHGAGLRVITDLVANHTSDRHPWFAAALAAGPGSPERDRYLFQDGRAGGAEPPNDWISAFGGRAWTRVREPDGAPGQWYLHLFSPQQPDLNWEDEAVRADFDDILRFWLDRGVDGLRVDAAPAMAKATGLPDAGHRPGAQFESRTWVGNPHWDVEGVHDILRRWRRIGDAYAGDRVFVAEAVVNGPERLSRYVRPDEMHTSFNFDYLTSPWEPRRLRQVIDGTLAALSPVGAPPTWVLSSHDETRHVTRFGRVASGAGTTGFDASSPTDPVLGLRRARAAALLTLALPGGAYLYQGEELGLPEVEDLPEEVLQDPTWERSGHTARGRDGCRVPLPWSGHRPPFGFTADGVRPWLPQPETWRELTVAAQRDDPASTLSLYRRALRLRRTLPGLADDPPLTWHDLGDGVLAFDRGRRFRCIVNLSDRPVPLVGQGEPVLTSSSVADDLPPDTAAGLRVH